MAIFCQNIFKKMTNATRLIAQVFRARLSAIDNFRTQGIAVQHDEFKKLLIGGYRSVYLSGLGVTAQTSYEQFAKAVPVIDYPAIKPLVELIQKGEENILWSNSPTKWFAKSSGTTAAQSKFIPITQRAIDECHYRGAKDTMILFSDSNPQSKAFNGKALTLGGSAKILENQRVPSGDLSAILIANAPWWSGTFRFPRAKIALMSDFQQKVEAICQQAVGQDVTSFAGVPSWNMVLMNNILDYSGKENMHQVWPNMSLFIHGGIGFKPYRGQYEKLFPDPQMRYMETYNASEGFFAMQDDLSDPGMLLMLDYGIFYEFLETHHLDDPSLAVPLEGVEIGRNYAMIISTSGGLWRYLIGDTVEFTSLSPYKIRITGRTKQFINAFGEELIVDNAEVALEKTCIQTGAIVNEYTAAPIFMKGRIKGSHQWVIEFKQEPKCSKAEFVELLDQHLQGVNSDYQAKRFKNTTLLMPQLEVVPSGTFMQWMSKKGKVGGQNKVPRLSGERLFVDGLIEVASSAF